MSHDCSRTVLRFGPLALGVIALLALPGADQPNDAPQGTNESRPTPLDWIRPSKDGSHFVRERTDQPIVFWGFNYDRDDSGRLLEDYWDDEWATVVEDFREMKALGSNVVRVHLQLAKFMTAPDQTDAANLARLGKLVHLAEETGLYLDVTGLGCYHKQDVPKWYDALEESARWDVQGRFWTAVANVCKGSPAVFCYNLMNEPILAGEKPETEWLGGELGGKFYVQRITLGLAGRTSHEVARAWIETLTSAIKKVDSRHMITLGVIPWAQIFQGAKPLFYAPEVGKSLDFVSVHFYPKADDLDGTLAALKVYEIGKPLVIEEIFPLSASVKQTGEFIKASRAHVDGWISFYWGKTIEQYVKEGGVKGALLGEWLTYFRAQAPDIKKIDKK
ncbi:MAG: cellulase family glycosylhydrolase [Isosphaeraceae bacterium]